jgi:hypothetical protein
MQHPQRDELRGLRCRSFLHGASWTPCGLQSNAREGIAKLVVRLFSRRREVYVSLIDAMFLSSHRLTSFGQDMSSFDFPRVSYSSHPVSSNHPTRY